MEYAQLLFPCSRTLRHLCKGCVNSERGRSCFIFEIKVKNCKFFRGLTKQEKRIKYWCRKHHKKEWTPVGGTNEDLIRWLMKMQRIDECRRSR